MRGAGWATLTSILLWPAVALHAALSIFLARVWHVTDLKMKER